MFSIGGRSFTHQIAEALGVDFETAENYKLEYDTNKLDDRVKSKIETALSRNISVWLTGVEVALEEFQNVGSLPRKILLCGGGAGLSAIPETLATGDWYKDLPFSRRPVVSLIDPDEIEGIENATDRELDHTFVTAMGLLRVGIDTLIGTGDDHSLRAKLARLLKN